MTKTSAELNQKTAGYMLKIIFIWLQHNRWVADQILW